jgi:hypothetical protein
MTNHTLMTHPDWTVPVLTLIHQLQNHDFDILSVNDGYEYVPLISKSGSPQERVEATEAIVAVDEAWLRIGRGGNLRGTIYIVLGNEPDELVADYSANTEDMMSLIEAAVEAHRKQWEGKKCPVLEVIQ